MTAQDDNLNVMIVNDHPGQRGLLRAIIKAYGGKATPTETVCRDVVEKYFENKPHLTFLDIDFCEVEGWEAVRRIRARDPLADIVIISTEKTDWIQDVYCDGPPLAVVRKDRGFPRLKQAIGAHMEECKNLLSGLFTRLEELKSYA